MRENNSYRFPLRIAHLLIFIHNGGIRNSTIQPRLKNDTHFSCYDILPKGYNVRPTRPSHYAPMNLLTIFTIMAITAISFNGKYYELTISHGQKHLRPMTLPQWTNQERVPFVVSHPLFPNTFTSLLHPPPLPCYNVFKAAPIVAYRCRGSYPCGKKLSHL